jgi:hypothetical protein
MANTIEYKWLGARDVPDGNIIATPTGIGQIAAETKMFTTIIERSCGTETSRRLGETRSAFFYCFTPPSDRTWESDRDRGFAFYVTPRTRVGYESLASDAGDAAQ